MGGWASFSFFCSGRAGGRRDFVVENRVGVGGRPDTPGPVGGPVSNVRLKFGADAVNLQGCGSFLLSHYLSSVEDITHIDLSNIESLEGINYIYGTRISRTIPLMLLLRSIHR